MAATVTGPESSKVFACILRVGEAVARAEALSDVYAAALDGLQLLLGAERSAVLLIAEDGVMRFVASRGLSPDYQRAVEGHNPWAPDDPDPRVVVVSDVATDPSVAAVRAVVLREGIRALAFVPLVFRGRLLGKFMAYFGESRELDAEDRQVACLLAQNIAFAIDRRRAEQALHRNKDELETVLSGVADAITAHGRDGRLVYANAAAARLLGFDTVEGLLNAAPSELNGAYDVLDEAGQPLREERLPGHRALQGEAAEQLIRYRLASGGPDRWSLAKALPVRDGDGEVRLAVNIVRDVTSERRQEERRRFMLEASRLLGASLDLDRTLQQVAELAVPAVADWCTVRIRTEDGIPLVAAAHVDPAKLAIGRAVVERIPLDEQHPVWRVMATGEPALTSAIDDEWLERSYPDPEVLALLRQLAFGASLTLPLTARGQVLGALSLAQAQSGRTFSDADLALATELAERAALAIDNARLYREAAEAHGRLELAMEAAQMGSWDFDVVRQRVKWSPGLARLHGVALEDFGGTFADYTRDIHPDDVAGVLENLQREMTGVAQHEVSYRIVRPDGTERWVEGRGRVVRDAEGRVVSMHGVCIDIDRRKRAEEALAAERERLAVTLRSIGDAVIATDTRGAVRLLNPVAEHLTGWSTAEAEGRPLAEVFPISSERTGQRIDNPVERVLATGRVVGLADGTILQSRDGTRRAIADSAAPIQAPDGSYLGVVLVFRDVTEEQRLEAELARASKLESLGVLAGGIAHDFNNILTAVLGNLSLGAARLAEGDPVRARLDAAKQACLRAQDLTRQLLTFARGGAPVKISVDVAPLVHESCALALQGSSCRAQIQAREPLWPVHADPGQLTQVVHNLVLNARQAMPDGGVVRIRADNLRVQTGQGVPVQPGRYVRIEVADDGPGIPPEIRERIFDPFFTTRPQGSGLGLATAFSILHRHDGHIAVRSEPSEGARFELYLPAADGEPTAVDVRPEPVRHGRGRVLVMDDDEQVRAAAGMCLEALGYETAFAEDGAQAVEAWRVAREQGRPFDLALMDLTVPGGMGGREAVALLLAMDPEVRAVVSSGYSNDPVMARFHEHGFVGVIQKPYTLEELGRVLADALA